jgi:multicomponent K+:H+ antiporter subunit F
MTATILSWSLLIAQIMLGIAMAIACFRMIRGPRAQDRIVYLDALYMNATPFLVVFGMRIGSTLYFEAALVISLLGFVSTLAPAKFLMRGEIIE